MSNAKNYISKKVFSDFCSDILLKFIKAEILHGPANVKLAKFGFEKFSTKNCFLNIILQIFLEITCDRRT